MIEWCFKTKSVMKTNRNDIYVVKKKSIYNLSQQRTDYKSPYFDSTFSALAALILWRSPSVHVREYR